MYRDFAYLYDTLMKNVDYKKWTNQVEEIFKRHGKQPKTIVDLACGTGGVTNILAERGYQITGVDISEDMLFVAREKARKSGQGILFVRYDGAPHRPVDAFYVCAMDSITYWIRKG